MSGVSPDRGSVDAALMPAGAASDPRSGTLFQGRSAVELGNEVAQERALRALHASRAGWWEWDVLRDTQRVDALCFAGLGYIPDDIPPCGAQAFRQSIAHPADRARRAEAYREHFAGNLPVVEIEYRARVADGDEYRWVREIAAIDKRTEDNRPAIVLGTLHDVHDRRVREERLVAERDELSRSNLDLERFATIASHDLRAPLRGIANMSTLLQRLAATELSDEGHKYLAMICDRSDRMRGLIDALLNHARVGEGGAKPETINVSGLIHEVVRLTGVPETMEFDCPRTDHQLRTPRVLLRQVVANLLANAFRYGGDGAAVRVELDERADWLVMAISDTGPGVAASDRERIFQPFVTGTSLVASGTGLGLAIVKRALDEVGGRISLRSEPGHTCFEVLWPKRLGDVPH